MEECSELGRLRRYRGKDEAVELIGNRDKMLEMLRDSASYGRNEIIEEILSCYSGKAYGDANWQKKIDAWGNIPERITIHGKFAEKHPGLEQLRLNPGIITHLPELMEFLDGKDANNPIQIMRGFREHLGEKIVFRGMMMNDEEAEKASIEGIECDFLRKKSLHGLIEDFEANVLSPYIDCLVEAHFHGENLYSPFISVSAIEDVAIAVGRHFGKKKQMQDDKKDFYLFKIRIPEMDLLHYTDHGIKMPYKLMQVVERKVNIKTYVNGRTDEHPWNKVESYVMFKIDPAEIIEISKPEVTHSFFASG